MSLSFDFPQVSFLQFWVTFGIGILMVLAMSLYMGIFVWFFGKPMRKYLQARLTFGYGIIQEYVHESVNLYLANVHNGAFTNIEKRGYYTQEKNDKKWYQFWKKAYIQILHKVKPIIGKSIVSINGVPTLLAWNVNPPLAEEYVEALKALINLGYTTPDDIREDIKSSNIRSGDKIEPLKMTYAEFLELHEAMRVRNSIYVSSNDVLDFNDKYLDEHPIQSIVEKTIVIEQKRFMDKTYQKYAFGIMAIMVIGGFLVIAWKIKYGGI